MLSSTSSEQNANSTLPKLLYFNGKGAAEMSRILLNIGDIEFSDVRYDLL